MESGLDWGLGNSRISPTWDLSNLSSVGLSAPLEAGRNMSWGLGNSEFSGAPAWSAGSSSVIGRGQDASSMLGSSKSFEIGGNDLWKSGGWNRMEDRQALNNQQTNIGSTGWGKVPVCQGTGWDAALGSNLKDSVRLAPESEMVLNGNNAGSNDGTEIWRANLAKSNVGLAAVGSVPSGVRGISSVNDSMSWVGRDVHSASADGMRQALHLTTSQQHVGNPAWDSNGTNIWGSVSSDAHAVPPVQSGMPVSNRVVNYAAMRRSPSLSSGTWNTADSPEADFGHWSQSSGAAGMPPAQQKIDNGTAVWGAPPVIPESFGSTRPATDAQQSVNILPISFDFSVPPPPVFKMSTAPGVPGLPANYWNPNLQTPKSVGNWGSVPGDSARSMNQATVPDWTDNSFNRKAPKLHGQPQMRSRLLQQLMDAGFRKEDAQNAIIRNDMNFERAMADLLANAPRVSATPDFSALLGDSRVRQPFQGPDNSFNTVTSISSSVYPPVLPQLPRDVQAKILAHLLQVSGGAQPSTLVSNEARAHEIQSKQLEQNLIQQKLVDLFIQAIHSGALPHQMLSLIAKPLSPAQIIILQQIVELQAVLLKLEETRSQTTPGEQKEQIEALITKIKSEIVNRQLSMTDKKQPSNGSSPVDTSFMGQLQALGLKHGDGQPALATESCASSNTASISPDFPSSSMPTVAVTGLTATTWPSIVSPLSSSAEFTDTITSHAKVITSASVSPSLAVTPVSSQSVSNAASSALNIKEFIPGKPWVGEISASGKALTDHWKAPGWGTLDTGSGLRRSSLTMTKRLDVATGSSSLSSSDWSLDITSAAASGLKSDLNLSVPTVWSPVDGKGSNAVSPAVGFLVNSSKSAFASGSSEAGAKTNATDVITDLGTSPSGDQADNAALKMLCNGWGDGSYEHGWSLGDDAADSALLPVDLLADQ